MPDIINQKTTKTMKLTIALALLACAPIGDSQALKINDSPEKKINAYDTT